MYSIAYIASTEWWSFHNKFSCFLKSFMLLLTSIRVCKTRNAYRVTNYVAAKTGFQLSVVDSQTKLISCRCYLNYEPTKSTNTVIVRASGLCVRCCVCYVRRCVVFYVRSSVFYVGSSVFFVRSSVSVSDLWCLCQLVCFVSVWIVHAWPSSVFCANSCVFCAGRCTGQWRQEEDRW